VIAYCRAFFIGRHRLGLKAAALRQQLILFKRNSRGLTFAMSTKHFGSPVAVCGLGNAKLRSS
jgi:hypothetical protein